MNDIPSWLCNDDCYVPKKDNSAFIDKSLKAFATVLSGFKRNSENKKAGDMNTSLRLLVMLAMIILTSVSRNFSFVFFMISVVAVRIAFLSSVKIKAYIKTILPVLIISFFILVPSVFLGNPKTPATVLSKIFVCVSLVSIVNLTSGFNDITRSLKLFHIPDVVIFTFDLAIKYIMILGEACSNMLNALKVRSIGKNKDKKSSVSGIMGTIFIKAKKYTDETNRAMECRGFNGEYVVKKEKFSLNIRDSCTLILLVAVVGVFVYLEVIL